MMLIQLQINAFLLTFQGSHFPPKFSSTMV